MDELKENKKQISLLETDGEYKLLELLDNYELTDRELEDFPFGMSTTFSRFFVLVQTSEDKIFFSVFEIGGCFCEDAFVLELNTFPSEEIISSIKSNLEKLHSRGRTVSNLIHQLGNIKSILDVKCTLINKFSKNEIYEDLLRELRNEVKEAISERLTRFKFQNSSEDEEILNTVINKVRKEYE